MITAIDKPNRDGTDCIERFDRLRPGAGRNVTLHQIARHSLCVAATGSDLKSAPLSAVCAS